MTSTLNTAAIPLEPETLRRLASQNGPCVTLLIPVSRPGAQDGARRVVVNDLVRNVAAQLHAHKWGVPPAELLGPLEEFAGTMNDGGGEGLGLFCAPGFFHVAVVPGESAASATIANHFHIAPLATAVFAPHDFYILGLNRRNLRLLHYAHGRCEEVPLPASVPKNEDVFNAFDKPDHELRNRSAAGSSLGSMGNVIFGTTSDHEDRREYEHHFYLAVDRGLKDTVKDTPLLLAGLHEEALEFRRAARHCKLLEAIVEGNPEYMKAPELAPRAAEAAVGHYHALGEAVMAKYREMPDRARTLAGVREVWKAAAAGRVHQLCAAEATEFPGDIHNPHSHEDLINAAIVETLRNGGDVFLLPKDRLPADSPVTAILRF
jgi:hypothetical protein